MDYVNWFSNIDPGLNPQNKLQLVMMYNYIQFHLSLLLYNNNFNSYILPQNDLLEYKYDCNSSTGILQLFSITCKKNIKALFWSSSWYNLASTFLTISSSCANFIFSVPQALFTALTLFSLPLILPLLSTKLPPIYL